MIREQNTIFRSKEKNWHAVKMTQISSLLIYHQSKKNTLNKNQKINKSAEFTFKISNK